MAKWYYKTLGSTVGPLSSREFLERVRAGDVTEEMHVRKDDALWVSARSVNGLFEYATERSADTVCPYCGSHIDPPPTRCAKCRRRISVSYEAHGGSKKERVETAAEQMQVGEHLDATQPDTIVANVAVISAAICLAVAFAFAVFQGFNKNFSMVDIGIFVLLLMPAIIAGFVFLWQTKRHAKDKSR